MIPGPYSVCRYDYDNSVDDAMVYVTLRYGYDTAEQAYAEIDALAQEAGISREELCVIRTYDHVEFEPQA